MNDPNRLLKWLGLIALVVLSLTIIYPPGQKLKGGIDLVGGTSLLFEVDTAGLNADQQRGLSSKVMGILKDRVDPKQQMNLEWRPVGNTRLEIRMPRPPQEAVVRRDAYNETQEKLAGLNLSRFEVESALSATGPARETALKGLQRGIVERDPLLADVTQKYNDYLAAESAGDATTVAAASGVYEQAMSALLAANLPVPRLVDVIALPKGPKRDEELAKIKLKYPSYDAGGPGGGAMSLLMRAYDLWAVNKADLEDPSDLKRRIKGAGVLEFRILADRNAGSPGMTGAPVEPIGKYTDQLAQMGPRTKAGDKYRWFPIDDIVRFAHVKNIEEFERVKDLPGQPITADYTGQYYVLMHNDPEFYMLPGSTPGRTWKLTQAHPDQNPMTGENVVSFTLDARGGRLFGDLTGNNVKRLLCIVLDSKAVSYATINERITERCQISGRFRPEQVADMVRILEAGSLPARLKETPLAEKTIGPSLGETNRANGIKAAMLGCAIVLLFMVLYYGVAGGGMADIALALNLLFTVAMMSMMNATFTLAGIAGLLLSIGMSIDANVLIFERIREERDRGVPFRKALNAGYDKAFSAIFDGNLTAFITCVILGLVGSEEVKGFAITLGIGIATSMFTALTVTRLVFNTLVAKGILSDFRMGSWIKFPKVDWVGLRGICWPLSAVAAVGGLGLFVWMGIAQPKVLFDIELIGGTSVQIDLKPTVAMTDEDVRIAVTEMGAGKKSAAQWLADAADKLAAGSTSAGDTPSRFVLSSEGLSGDQIASLVRGTLAPHLESGGIRTAEKSATFDVKSGQLDPQGFKDAVNKAVEYVRAAADRVRNSRVQSVGDLIAAKKGGGSFEVVTSETDRELFQSAIVSTMGDRLNVQRALRFTAVSDESATRQPLFVIEAEDQYFSYVLTTESRIDIRRFRGGVAIEVKFDAQESPVTQAEVEKRLREVALQSQYEQYHTRESAVFPLGASVKVDGADAYKHFAVAAVDENLLYDDDHARWETEVAQPKLAQVEAALGSEKSLSKVVQFAPSVAAQAKNKAVLGIVLSLMAVSAYVWLRFGNKEFGLAVLVCIVHDVSVVLGLVALSHYIHDTFLGRLLMIDDFKVDLTMIAAVLTLIGYTMNDTIVVFDRLREIRGKSGTLSALVINEGINQTMTRNIVLAFLVFITVFVLYVFGGGGIHGFAFAMLMGTLVNTYSTVCLAVPLVYKPRTLYVVWTIIATVIVAGVIFAQDVSMTVRLVLAAAVFAFGAWRLIKGSTTGGVPQGTLSAA